MLPTGVIWQRFRQDALDVVPVGTAVVFRHPVTLDKWFESGTYTLSASNAKKFDILVNAADFGSALYTEASFFIDHATEQSISFRHLRSNGRWQSPAWSAVSVYYWAFYLILAITRTLGRSPWFIADDAYSVLKRLVPSGSKAPGSGAYILECGPIVSATQRHVALRQGARVHDAVWRLWFQYLRSVISQQTGRGDSERLLYESIVCTANALGDSWPSELRNYLNYGPGIGYGAIRGSNPAGIFGAIDAEQPSSLADTISRFSVNAQALTASKSILDQIGVATRVLVDLCFILDCIARNLHNEVRDRRGIDQRWLVARRRFSAAQSKPYRVPNWPSSDVFF